MDGGTLSTAHRPETAGRFADPRRRIAWAVIVLSIVVIAGLIWQTGENPASVIAALIGGGFLSFDGLADTTVRAIPLCLIGVGIALAFRAGVFNIGADGQLVIGAAVAVASAGALAGLPSYLGLPLLLLAGMAGGAAWGGVAGILKTRFGANEIIATIMLNYIAIQVVSWMVRGPLQEPMGIFPRSDRLADTLRLPIMITDTRVTLGLLVALATVLLAWFVLSRTRYGFELVVTGENQEAARYGGIRPGWIIASVMCLSGALAGLAGTVEVSGIHGRLEEGFAAGFGITAIAVALLARLNPLLVPFSAFGLAGLYVGSATVARTTAVPFPLIHVIEAAIIFSFLASTVLRAEPKSQ